MSLPLTLLLFALGIVFIVKGGDWFVDAASWMAEVSGIPRLIVGATVVSLATTLPELLVSSLAAMQGKVDMAIGNAVGSATVNVALILALALICMPGPIRRRDYFCKSLLLLAAALFLVVFSSRGRLDPLPAVLLLVLFAAALWENVAAARQSMRTETAPRPRPNRDETGRSLLKFLFGTLGIVLGARLLVDNGSSLALLLGVPERVVGVTVIALGTSLPELVTTLTAIAKKQASLSAGNILGANIIDLTLILPVGALIYGGPLPISPRAAALDLPACLLVALIALVPALITGKFHRWQGVLLLAVYAVYLFFTCVA